MGIGRVLPKYYPRYIVEDCKHIFPMRLVSSVGYVTYFIMAKSFVWSIEPKAFLKSMQRMYISWFVNLASSSAVMRS